jgi:hypothetical protein
MLGISPRRIGRRREASACRPARGGGGSLRWPDGQNAVGLRRRRGGGARSCGGLVATGRGTGAGRSFARGNTAATARPGELTQTAGAIAMEAVVQAPGRLLGEPAGQPATEPALAKATQAVPLPARRPPNAALSAVQRLARVALPKIMTGAQPILPPGFSAYADMGPQARSVQMD